MDVRRPLQVLPLDCFLPLTDTASSRANPYKSSTKRSRSPSVMLSPAKRRILYQEGCLASPSSGARASGDREKFSKQDECPRGRFMSRGFLTINDEGRHEDRGPPFNDMAADRSRPIPSSSIGTAPPRAQTGSSRQSSRSLSVDPDYPPACQRVMAPPLMVPREMPPRPDPQSLHYPGFDIYYDTHIELPTTSSRFKLDVDVERDKEEAKENLYLKKMTKKLASVIVDDGSTYSRVDAGSQKPQIVSYPATPHCRVGLRSSTTPLAERSLHPKTTSSHGFTPGRSPDKSKSRLAMRQVLKDEVDDVCSGDEDI